MRHRYAAVALTLTAAVALAAGFSPQPIAQTAPSAAPPSAAVPMRGAICSTASPAASVPTTVEQWAEGAKIFDGLGDRRRSANTQSPEAQKFFDQGMRFLWAFNHDEATRSFAQAARLDPHCAICFWGVSLTVGPNYNLPEMAGPRAAVAWRAVQQAQRLADQASPVERALIEALAKRYRGPEPLDPAAAAPLLIAYAEAMRAVAAQFPDDVDVQVMAAEAQMNVNAWKLWDADGTPAPGTAEIVAALEQVMAKDPSHPGANHYFIHTIEASPNPERGIPAAQRLAGAMPAAGHLEHMPAHIHQRVGQYAAAAAANRAGIAADLAYFAQATPPDYYAMYTGHNYQFLAFSASMAGQKAATIEAARQSRALMTDDMLLAMPGPDWHVAMLYPAMVRFGMWDEILAEPAPNAKVPGSFSAHLFATAAALAAKGRLDEARNRLAELEQLAADLPPGHPAGLNALKDVLAVAALTVKTRIAIAENRPGEAIALLQEAVAKEDRLAYNEPEDWFVPGRHLLGALLLRAGRPAEAEQVYRDDLARHPENGWALFGLARALEAQQKTAEAAAVQGRFKTAWEGADLTLLASAF